MQRYDWENAPPVESIIDPTPYNRRDLYLGNHNIRRAGSQKTQWTIELMEEYEKCKRDVTYFCARYVKVINLDRGMVNFVPYPYQDVMWRQFNDNRFNIVLACRQSGKTQAVVGYLLWYTIFHRDQTVAVVAHKGDQAREILGRYTLALENLPFFLQPGCKSQNKGRIEFDHNTNIFAAATSSGSLRGKSVNLLYLDEFAFVEHDTQFMMSTYPIISSGKSSRVIITSTANGVGNQFHKIWKGATTINPKTGKQMNDYTSFRVDWWDVPGRDEEWKAQTIRNTSEKQFEQEFGNSFLGSSNTLIDGHVLETLTHDLPIWEAAPNTGEEGIRVYEKPIKETDETDRHNYVMTVDVSKGRGKDFSTFTVFDVTETPYKTVCVYQNATISPMYFPDLIYKWAKVYNDALVLIESNDEGASVARELYHTLEYENTFVESVQKAHGIGVFVDKKVKHLGCSRLKDLVEANTLLVADENALLELSAFVREGETWKGDNGCNDDLVSNLWLFGWFVQTDFFDDYVGGIDLKKRMFDEKLKMIEQSIPFVGMMGNLDYDARSELLDRGYLPPGFEDELEHNDFGTFSSLDSW